MSIDSFGFDEGDSVVAEINMIPLVDIMLVLLIVFIITAPVMHHAFNLQLPQESNQPQNLETKSIQVAIQNDGSYRWGSDVVTEGELTLRFAEAGKQEKQPALHLSADKDTRYEAIIQVMGLAQQASLKQISFVTDPSQ